MRCVFCPVLTSRSPLTAHAFLLWLKHHPTQLSRLYRDRSEYLFAIDLGPGHIGPWRHITHGEVLSVERVRVCLVSIGLGERERRLGRVSLDDAVHSDLRNWCPGAIEYLAGDDASPGERLDPKLGVGGVGRKT